MPSTVPLLQFLGGCDYYISPPAPWRPLYCNCTTSCHYKLQFEYMPADNIIYMVIYILFSEIRSRWVQTIRLPMYAWSGGAHIFWYSNRKNRGLLDYKWSLILFTIFYPIKENQNLITSNNIQHISAVSDVLNRPELGSFGGLSLFLFLGGDVRVPYTHPRTSI